MLPAEGFYFRNESALIVCLQEKCGRQCDAVEQALKGRILKCDLLCGIEWIIYYFRPPLSHLQNKDLAQVISSDHFNSGLKRMVVYLATMDSALSDVQIRIFVIRSRQMGTGILG